MAGAACARSAQLPAELAAAHAGTSHRCGVLLLQVALLYSPISTARLSAWLDRHLPPTADLAPRDSVPAVVVLVGRGPQVAAATTTVAAYLVQNCTVSAVYVSVYAISTAQSLKRHGVPPDQIAGDSCAPTTWENATRTTAWLRRNHPSAPARATA